MNQILGIGVLVASVIMVYFLHTVLEAEVIPIVLFLCSISVVVVDYQRRYFYLVGLALYPLGTTINVAMSRNESLYPIVIFYELSMVAFILFGTFLGVKVKHWLKAKSLKS